MTTDRTIRVLNDPPEVAHDLHDDGYDLAVYLEISDRYEALSAETFDGGALLHDSVGNVVHDSRNTPTGKKVLRLLLRNTEMRKKIDESIAAKEEGR